MRNCNYLCHNYIYAINLTVLKLFKGYFKLCDIYEIETKMRLLYLVLMGPEKGLFVLALKRAAAVGLFNLRSRTEYVPGA